MFLIQRGDGCVITKYRGRVIYFSPHYDQALKFQTRESAEKYLSVNIKNAINIKPSSLSIIEVYEEKNSSFERPTSIEDCKSTVKEMISPLLGLNESLRSLSEQISKVIDTKKDLVEHLRTADLIEQDILHYIESTHFSASEGFIKNSLSAIELLSKFARILPPLSFCVGGGSMSRWQKCYKTVENRDVLFQKKVGEVYHKQVDE